MKRSLVFVAFLLLLPVLIFSQPGDNTAIPKSLTDMSTALKASDIATLKKAWADDYTFVATTSLAYNKTERENIMKNALAVQSIGNPVALGGRETVPDRQDTSGKAEQAIKAIEQEMLDALLKGDASANEKYMANTYIFTSPGGEVQDKATAIRDLKSGDLKIESSKRKISR